MAINDNIVKNFSLMLTIFIINKDISLNEVVEEVLNTSVCFVH